jgi:8-oxo-dGTP pyrophosphatase MutT (NUDIX family)
MIWKPITGDFAVAGMEREERILTPAAVLVPLVERPDGYTVLLTQRTAHLGASPRGQISFPGGRAEDEDASPVHTALREAEEEIGLQRRHVVEIAGFLDLYQTVTGFLVTPVVGFVDAAVRVGVWTLSRLPRRLRSRWTSFSTRAITNIAACSIRASSAAITSSPTRTALSGGRPPPCWSISRGG